MSKLIVNSLGYGFINHTSRTIFIPKQYLNDAKNDDVVEYKIIDENNNIAEITKIVDSAPEYGYVSHIWKNNFIIKTESKKQIYLDINNYNLNIDDMIQIKNNNILMNFGNRNDFKNKINYIKYKYEIKKTDYQFNINQIDNSEIERVDLTDLYTFTIDPTTSKDFDDAISISSDGTNYKLGVHIADVSSFIKVNSELDLIARNKMNTTYLNGDTNHMLPTELSNNLCSLVPGEIRKTVTVMANFNNHGELIDYQIFRSKIKSKKRYTYQDVREQINNYSMDNNIKNLYNFVSSKYTNVLGEFNLPIIDLKLDINKTPVNIELENYDMAHIMIEKCMILANEIVAEDLCKKNKLFPFRCHPKPNKDQEEKYNYFKQFSNNAFYQEVIKIKSYKNAFYSYKNISHYGLSSEKYCHFTSPIRRYIDIVIHRILLDEYQYSEEELEVICNLANKLESNSFKAENELLEIQKEYLIENSNTSQPAMIIDANKYGITVELLNYITERKIHISKLSDKRLIFDPINKKIYNNETTFTIGDIINF